MERASSLNNHMRTYVCAHIHRRVRCNAAKTQQKGPGTPGAQRVLRPCLYAPVALFRTRGDGRTTSSASCRGEADGVAGERWHPIAVTGEPPERPLTKSAASLPRSTLPAAIQCRPCGEHIHDIYSPISHSHHYMTLGGMGRSG